MKFKKIDNKLNKFLYNAIYTAKLLKIDSIVLDSLSLRGKSEEGIMILQDKDLPSAKPFDAIGISRVATLWNRVSLFDTPTITVEISDRLDNGESIARSLNIKSGRTSVGFLCHKPSMIKAPKTIADPIGFTFTMDKDSVGLLSRMTNAINSKSLLLEYNGKKMMFKVSEEGGDMLKHVITKDIAVVDGDIDDTFAFSYKMQNITPILKEITKHHENFEINITKRGFLSVNVNGLNVYILCERD